MGQEHVRKGQPTRLDVVHERAQSATGAQAVCFRCVHYLGRTDAANVGLCAMRGERQFRFGVCLEWQRMPGSVVSGVGF